MGDEEPTPVRADPGKSETRLSGGITFGGDVHLHGVYVAGRDMYVFSPKLRSSSHIQLPPDVDDLTGRHQELREIASILTPSRHHNTTEGAVVTIIGKAGVGKTALATRVANRVRRFFPDGQFYVNLRGVESYPLDPADVLEDLLLGLGMESEALPDSLDERAARLRAWMGGSRVLVVLDNASTEPEIRPLLPITPGSAVLITSRAPVAGLTGIPIVPLDVLEPEHAVKLLAELVGAKRVAAEPEATHRLVELCGYLPLAIRIAGATLAERTQWTLARLADRLADDHTRLAELNAEDLEVRATFQLSYQQLPDELRRVVRWLSLLRVSAVAADVVGALVDVELERADRWLRALVRARLVEMEAVEGVAERYRLHDVLTPYAGELAEQDPVEERHAALRRGLAWYLEQSDRMDGLQNVGRVELEQLPKGNSHSAEDARADPAALRGTVEQGAMSWFDAERANLVAVQRQAAELGEDEMVWRLATSLRGFFEQRMHWSGWRVILKRAALAARRVGNREAEGRLLGNLGVVYLEQGEPDEAAGSLEQALAIVREVGNRKVEGRLLGNLGVVYLEQGQLDEAAGSLEQALAIVREVGDRYGEGLVLHDLGVVYREQRRFDEAAGSLEQALAIVRGVGDRYGEGLVLHDLGVTYVAQGIRDLAQQCLTQALAIFEELQSPQQQQTEAMLADLNRP